MFGLFVMLGRQLNRNLSLVILKDTFLSSKSQLSFDCRKTLVRSLRHVMHVHKRGGEVGHLALFRCGETVGEIEGTEAAEMMAVSGRTAFAVLVVHEQIIYCWSADFFNVHFDKHVNVGLVVA